MKCKKETMLLYAVTDRTWIGRQTLYEQVESALKGGATCIQLREKHLEEAAFLEEAIAMRKLCSTYHVPLIINDNVNVALQCGADGVHVGQKDLKAGDVRDIVGEKMMIGVSARTVEQALAAQAAGADYLGVGAVFTTTTKLDTKAVSYETLKEICSTVHIPVVAIGGIHKNNIAKLSGAGVDGVALVSAIFAADDIQKECQLLKQLSSEMVSAK